MLDQKWQIVTKKCLSALELNDIKIKLVGVTEESDKNNSEGSVGFGEEDNAVFENEGYVVLEDTCLNQDQYSNNDDCEAVTRLALKCVTVLQGDENEIFEQLIIFVYLYIRKERSS